MTPPVFPAPLTGSLYGDPELWTDFAAICDCGGRVSGTPSERRAIDLLRHRGTAATGQPARSVATAYEGWSCTRASLTLLTAAGPVTFACEPLLRSAGGAVTAEIVPVGRGTEAEFAALGTELRGRIALVRHEYMFAAGHLHRRAKYYAAVEAGAVGFLIAGPLPGATVAGGAGPEIPALGISPETAARLSPRDGRARAQIRIDAVHAPAKTEALLFDMPSAGGGPERVVLSAHIDGHAPAESALDNASGLAVALAVARWLAPHVASAARGLTLAFFSAEEWALSGSHAWLAGLDAEARGQIALNINLDTVAGARALTALVSDFPGLAAFVREVARGSSIPFGVHLPLMANSDHANFAALGIPALRLVAGFDDPTSDVRYVMTAADTRDKADPTELRKAALAATAIVWAGLNASADEIDALRRR